MYTVRDIDGALHSLVRKVSTTSQCNVDGFSVADFRESTAACLTDIRADNARFGDAESPFWNLLMYDGGANTKALFVITIFSAEHLRVCASSGIPSEVITSCERFTMSEVLEFTIEFDSSYAIGANSFDIPRPLAEYWLGGADV